MWQLALMLGSFFVPYALLGQVENSGWQAQPLRKAEPMPDSLVLRESFLREAPSDQPTLQPIQKAPASEPAPLPPTHTPYPSRETQKPETL